MKLAELLQQNKVGASEPAGEQQPAATVRVSENGVDRVQHLQTVLSVIRKINTSLILSDVLALVIDHAIRITHADRGLLMLANKDGKLQHMIGHDRSGGTIPAENFIASSSVVENVFQTGESLCIEDALNDERFENRQSVINLELKTIFCAPLRTQEATIGVIYVDSRHIHAMKKEEVLQLFEILAGHAAFAIENARLYENLNKAYHELKEANEHILRSERMVLRGEIAGEVTHELNNILNVALFQCLNLQRDVKKNDKEKTEQDLKGVITSLRRMANFSENLLIGTRKSSKVGPVKLNEMVRSFVAFISVLPNYNHAKINVELDEELGEVHLDVDQFQQVLLNLANNALDACSNATLTFRTEYHFVKNVAKLVVEDDGPGIEPSIREKLFNERVTTKAKGHGFGLPVCRKIIQHHRGEIAVESELGRGTRFIITLPLPMEQV